VPDFDPRTPSIARVYDYLLGGKDNFAADREAARQLLDAIPDVAAIARDKRSVLGRVVRYLATEGGVRQFLDLGSGLPTQANVHQLAQGVLGFAPGVHVVYVDNDYCKSGCTHAQGRSGCLRRTRGAPVKKHVTRCKRWGRQAGYEPAGAGTAEPGMVVPGWMR